MKKYICIFLSLSACLTYSLHGAAIEILCGPSLEVDPGGVATIIFKTEEMEGIQFPLEVHCPEGWTPLIPLKEGDASGVFIYPVQVPPGIRPGRCVVQVCRGSTSESITVHVGSQRELQFTWQDLPPIVAEGQDFSLSLRGVNTGNTSIPLAVVVEVDKDGSAWCDADKIVLQPGETFDTTTHICVTPSYARSRRRVVQLRVYDMTTQEEVFQKCAVIEVLPCGIDEPIDPWVRMEGFTRIFAAGCEGKIIGGTEFYGRGYVDEYGWREVDYQFLIPSDSHTNLYNEYQRLYVGVHDPDFELLLGDTYYSLTPLTEKWRFARGIGLEAFSDRWSFGSFYAQNRLNHCCQLEEGAAFALYRFNPYSTFSVNYIKRTEKDLPTGSIISGLSENIYPNGYFTAEYAYDMANKFHQGDKNAYFVGLRQQLLDDSWIYAEKTYAGRGFYGYYNNADYYSAGADIALGGNWRASLSTTRVKENFDCNESSAPRWRQYNARLCCCDFPFQVALTGFLLKSYDAFNLYCNNFSQAWGGVQYSYIADWCAFFGNSEVGGQKNYATGIICKPLQRHNFDFRWSWTPSKLFFLHYECGNSNYFDARQWRYSSGGGVIWRYDCVSFAEMQLRAINDRFYGNPEKRYNGRYVHFLARLSHTFGNAHHLGIRFDGFFSRPADQRDKYEFLVSYTIPTRTPVKYREDFGTLSGCVFDEITGMPVADALVAIGEDKRLTDAQGRFSYSSLAPGQYSIQAELLPNQLIQCEAIQPAVFIQGGRQAQHAIAVARGGSLEGCISYTITKNALS